MIFAWTFICLLQVFDSESLKQGLGLLGISRRKSNVAMCFHSLDLGGGVLNTVEDLHSCT